MSAEDRMIGTAVLVETPTYHWLWALRVGTNIDGVGWSDLPMLPEGAPVPAEPLPSWFKCVWRYTIVGQFLHGKPSINIGDDWWHNTNPWQVSHVRIVGPHQQQLALKKLAEMNPDHAAKILEMMTKWA